MRKIVMNLFLFFFITASAFSQIPDSLLGIYVGQQHYKYDNSDWIITEDTEYITAIDTILCKVDLHGCFGYGGGHTYFFSDYNFCNGNSPSVYAYPKFFDGDSIKIIHDNVPTPPPDVHFISKRFFGKRIPNTSWVGVKEQSLTDYCKIFPNPAIDHLLILFETPCVAAKAEVYSISGQLLLSEPLQLSGNMANLMLGKIPSGMYVLRIIQDGAVMQKKFLKL